MTIITCVEDFRQLYQRRVPRMFYDYAESGSYTETTFRANEQDFHKLHLRQRVGIDISTIDTSTTIAGTPVAMPVAFAPVGMLGFQHAGGEIAVAREANKANVPFILSTMSVCSIEDVAQATGAPFWFQLYVSKDREFAKNLVKRAKAAHCSELVVTMDLTMLGQRHRDVKNRLAIRPNLKNLINIATKPRWAWQIATTPYKSFGNVVGHAKGVDDLSSLGVWASEMLDPSLSWDDVADIQEQWGRPVIVKGIMDTRDAIKASQLGVKAIVVSNHGGRQLDGAASTITSIESIAEAVGNATELILDSGVRTGIDVFRAKALGASGVLIGRAMVYALGSMGQRGIATLLEILHKELRTTMGLAGKTTIADIKREDVYWVAEQP